MSRVIDAVVLGVAVLELPIEIPVTNTTKINVVHFRASVRPQT